MSTILVATHEPVLVSLIAEHLEREGLRVVEAHDASAALELARRCEPDVIVLDLGLPDPSARRATGNDPCSALRTTEPPPAAPPSG